MARMLLLRAVLVAAVVSLSVTNAGPPWLLGAWNIRKFGIATMGKTGVPAVITEVIKQFHLIVIQEVQDSNNVAIPALLNMLNNGMPSNDRFVCKISDQRTNNKGKKIERYAAFYRPLHIQVVEDITYNGPSRKFTYPPYELVLQVKQGNNQLYRFGMIVLHTKPALAVPEMDNLADEARNFMSMKNLHGVLIAGDLNVKNKKGPRLTDPDFKWLINDDINTSINGFTAPNDVRPYDRMIVLGDNLWRRITGAEAYCYDTDPRFSWPVPYSPFGTCVPRGDRFRLVMHVSDHYPVRVQMK